MITVFILLLYLHILNSSDKALKLYERNRLYCSQIDFKHFMCL